MNVIFTDFSLNMSHESRVREIRPGRWKETIEKNIHNSSEIFIRHRTQTKMMKIGFPFFRLSFFSLSILIQLNKAGTKSTATKTTMKIPSLKRKSFRKARLIPIIINIPNRGFHSSGNYESESDKGNGFDLASLIFIQIAIFSNCCRRFMGACWHIPFTRVEENNNLSSCLFDFYFMSSVQ